MNSSLRLALSKGASSKMVAENWDFLQVQVRHCSSMERHCCRQTARICACVVSPACRAISPRLP